jgi:hypothetical protein
MSLRSFHIFFIVTALGLVAFLGIWSAKLLTQGAAGSYKILACCSVIGLIAGIPYLVWFVRKGTAHAST